MGEPVSVGGVAYDAYLAIEAATGRKHEWLLGEVHAMAGGTLAHSGLCVAVGAELRVLARQKGCRVFSSDAKVRVPTTGLATYPDVSVVCGSIERDADDRHALTNPSVLVEILSEGTEAYDRGAKFAHYRELPTLRDYVLVSQHERRIEVYSRDGEGGWVLREAVAGGVVSLVSLPGQLEVDRVYDGIELEAPAARPLRLG